MPKSKKLPSGNWRVQASKMVNGALVRKSFTNKDRKKAESEALKWQTDPNNETTTENITLFKAYEKYIEVKKNVLSPTTICGYISMQNNIFETIMQLKIAELTTPKIQSAVNLLSANHSPKYVRNAYGLLSAVLSMFRPDFSPHISLPQKEKSEMYIPDDKDIQKLLKAVKGQDIEIPILLAAFGPMRRSEICALTSDDIHGNTITVNKALVRNSKNEWQIKTTKTYSSNRNIELPDFVIEKIKNKSGKITDMTPSSITNKFSKVLKKAGLPNFRFHDLRHYAVSTLHAINVPDKYIMARGGWATNYTMNNVYNHTLRSKQDAFELKINSHFKTLVEDETV